MKSDPRICPYLDMPIQHIDDRMLKAMHRTTSRSQIEETIRLLRKEIPDVSIRTSLMVGFPGETEEQFQELLRFVKKAELDQVGIFQFSLEKEAYAAKLPNQVDDKVKRDRFERLAAAQYKAVRKKNQKWIGRKVRAMVEGYHPESKLLLRARHSGQCPDIDGQILINDPRGVDAFGKLHDVEITDAADYDLVGRVIATPSRKASCKLSLVSG